MSALTLAQWLWWLEVAVSVVLYLRLRHEGLHRIYRWFAVYLLFALSQGVALGAVPFLLRKIYHFRSPHMGSNAYAVVWLTTEPILAVLYVLVVLELYTLVFQKYKGIASLGRWAVFAGLVLGVVIASVTLSPDLSNSGEQFPFLRYFFVLQRGVTSSLVLFLLFITLFLVWYPVPLSRNLIAHSLIFSVYFLSITGAFLLRNIGGGAAGPLTSALLSGTTLACLLAWTGVLSRSGEKRTATVNHHWKAEDQQHVIEQLAAINSALLRTARK